MQYNERYFRDLEDGLYAIFYRYITERSEVIKKIGNTFFVIQAGQLKPTLHLNSVELAQRYEGHMILGIKFLKFEPENSEYAGNSELSGQSAGIDLIKALISPCKAGFEQAAREKINELVYAINKLNKPSETTKEQPLTNNDVRDIMYSLESVRHRFAGDSYKNLIKKLEGLIV